VTGIFAEWQPRYAKHRVATFPVKNKRPCVRHWQKFGLKGSSQLVMKFPDADAFGFQCGARNRITIIDIDSREDCVVEEAIKLFGQSPILWRTGSGNHAMPFRYNGEARKIRALPELPIDVLGGGFAVAPPSMGSTGRYEFLQGGLADLDRLPVARSINIEQAEPRKETPGRTKGKRDDTLFRHALEQHPMSMTLMPSSMWCARAIWTASRHCPTGTWSGSQPQRGVTKRREETSSGGGAPSWCPMRITNACMKKAVTRPWCSIAICAATIGDVTLRSQRQWLHPCIGASQDGERHAMRW
jgi:Bifunctional DNA primase/polymerase, N-terminal